MIDWLFAKLAGFAIGKKVLDGVHGINEKLSGKRTEISIALEIIILTLRKFGLIPAGALEAADLLATALLGVIPVTAAEKIKRAKNLADKVVADQPAA